MCCYYKPFFSFSRSFIVATYLFVKARYVCVIFIKMLSSPCTVANLCLKYSRMSSPEECMNHAAEVARQATHFDTNGSHQAAVYMYRQAAVYLERAAALGLSSPAVLDRITQYRNRASVLEQSGKWFFSDGLCIFCVHNHFFFFFCRTSETKDQYLYCIAI